MQYGRTTTTDRDRYEHATLSPPLDAGRRTPDVRDARTSRNANA